MKRRSTPQLRATYEAVAAAADHPSADQVLERVRHSLPRVSLGTIYRNLDKLRDLGRLRVLQLAGGSAHYDAMMEPHDHFVCEACGAVADLEPDRINRQGRKLERAGLVVRWQTTAVYGLCRSCASTMRETKRGAAHG
jgi:Fe2+ or Zn2+ uptake regulation protein